MAQLVPDGAKVYGIDHIQEINDFAKSNIKKICPQQEREILKIVSGIIGSQRFIFRIDVFESNPRIKFTRWKFKGYFIENICLTLSALYTCF
mgnify:CR=1 FL=1